jgi:hypothetical protein
MNCSFRLRRAVRPRHFLEEAREHHAHDVGQERGPLLGGVWRKDAHDRMRRPEEDRLQRLVAHRSLAVFVIEGPDVFGRFVAPRGRLEQSLHGEHDVWPGEGRISIRCAP